MLENISPVERGRLEQAFRDFNQLSDQLQASYRTLEQRVAHLTVELEDTRAAREREARNARRLASRLELLLATLPAGVVVIDPSGVIQETNPAAEALLGTGLEGCAWHTVAAGAFTDQLPASGEWLTCEGRRVSILTSALTGETGRILLLADVTETRALEELVNRNQRLSAMGKMAASLAHQIRTPLASALLYLSQCRTLATDAKSAGLLQRGIERLHHLNRLVQDMLVFARGNAPGERVRIADLFRAVHQAVMGVKPENAHLIIDGTDVLLEIEGNRTALVAALSNLVSNAFEAAPDVVVTLKAQLRGNRVELEVGDNGPGIEPAIQSRVFEPFFSTRPAGTGLGLAVVKTVAEAHGGELELSSDPDCGTTVGIELPATESEHRLPPTDSGERTAREVA